MDEVNDKKTLEMRSCNRFHRWSTERLMLHVEKFNQHARTMERPQLIFEMTKHSGDLGGEYAMVFGNVPKCWYSAFVCCLKEYGVRDFESLYVGGRVSDSHMMYALGISPANAAGIVWSKLRKQQRSGT